jgi:hypothetical protein
MAGHLPIPTTKEHSSLVLELNKIKRIQDLPHFLKVEGSKGTFMRLPTEDYNMDDESGFVDEYVISHTKYNNESGNMDELLEIHLDKEGRINIVYLVM